jgi:hypothetical protein
MDPGQVANYYHHQFSSKLYASPGQTMSEIATVIHYGAKKLVYPGFRNRNYAIGRNCDVLLAYTFGKEEFPEDGGTEHTWHYCKAATKVHIDLNKL